MATDSSLPCSDSELLYQFLGERLDNGGRDEPIDRLLTEFSDYRRQLVDLRDRLSEAEAACNRGEAKPLDAQDTIRRGRERMAREGIID